MKEKVYDIVKQIPYGKVATYGQIARILGNKNAARAVGNILHRNPDEKTILCYKVLNSKGKLSEHFAFGGLEEQKNALKKEGVTVSENKVDLKIYQWKRFE